MRPRQSRLPASGDVPQVLQPYVNDFEVDWYYDDAAQMRGLRQDWPEPLELYVSVCISVLVSESGRAEMTEAVEGFIRREEGLCDCQGAMQKLRREIVMARAGSGGGGGDSVHEADTPSERRDRRAGRSGLSGRGGSRSRKLRQRLSPRCL